MASHQLATWFLQAFEPGWGHVIQQDGRKTMRPGRPSVELLARHLGLDGEEPAYLAIRPSSRTTWVAIDVDQPRSPHHPDRGEGALEQLLERLKLIGLRSPLIFQSSHSRGLHLWFPLQKAHKSFDVALSIKLALEAGALDAGELGESLQLDQEKPLEVAPGLLEVFPNVKLQGSDYHAIRLPFTGQGNGLWIDGIGVVEEPACLPDRWRAAARCNTVVQAQRISKRESDAGPYNLYEPETDRVIPVNWVHPRPQPPAPDQVVYAYKGEGIQQAREEARGRPSSVEQARALLARGWTGPGQTQDLQLAALMLASQETGDPGEVAKLVKDLLVRAPGFSDWCGHIKEIQSGAMPGRAACRKAATFKQSYRGTWRQRANQAKADNTGERALAAIAAARALGERLSSINQAIAHLRATHGSPSRAWWFKAGNTAYLEQLRALVAETAERG